MENFYTDNPHLRFHLNHPLMEKIVKLKESGYSQKEKYDFAPLDFADAIDNYDKVMEIIGEISGEIIGPNAESVDKEGQYVGQYLGMQPVTKETYTTSDLQDSNTHFYNEAFLQTLIANSGIPTTFNTFEIKRGNWFI